MPLTIGEGSLALPGAYSNSSGPPKLVTRSSAPEIEPEGESRHPGPARKWCSPRRWYRSILTSNGFASTPQLKSQGRGSVETRP